MAEFSYPFNAIETSPGVYDRAYDATNLARAFSHLQDGVAHGLTVTAGTGMNTILASGLAFISGYSYYNDAPLTKAHSAANATYDRIDYVALRLDLGARTVTSVVLAGTPAASPAAPALANTATTVEIALYEVLIRKGSTQILATDITPTARSVRKATYLPTNADLNTIIQSGDYSGASHVNGPAGVTAFYMIVLQYGQTANTGKGCVQILVDYYTGFMYTRYKRYNQTTWGAWNQTVYTTMDANVTFNGAFIRPNIPHIHATGGNQNGIAINTDVPLNMSAGTNMGGWTMDGTTKFVVPVKGLYQINAFIEAYVKDAAKEMFMKVVSYNAANAVLGSYTVDCKNTYNTPTSWVRCTGSIQLLLEVGQKISLIANHTATTGTDVKSSRLTVAQIAGY